MTAFKAKKNHSLISYEFSEVDVIQKDPGGSWKSNEVTDFQGQSLKYNTFIKFIPTTLPTNRVVTLPLYMSQPVPSKPVFFRLSLPHSISSFTWKCCLDFHAEISEGSIL